MLLWNAVGVTGHMLPCLLFPAFDLNFRDLLSSTQFWEEWTPGNFESMINILC